MSRTPDLGLSIEPRIDSRLSQASVGVLFRSGEQWYEFTGRSVLPQSRASLFVSFIQKANIWLFTAYSM